MPSSRTPHSAQPARPYAHARRQASVTRTVADPSVPAGGNTGIQLDGLLSQLGVSATERIDDVAAALETVLTERHVPAWTVASLRRDKLVVSVDAQTAALLRYDTDRILAAVNELLTTAGHTTVRSVTFSVARP